MTIFFSLKVMILSTVRSSLSAENLGFLINDKRFNVAITRAQALQVTKDIENCNGSCTRESDFALGYCLLINRKITLFRRM